MLLMRGYDLHGLPLQTLRGRDKPLGGMELSTASVLVCNHTYARGGSVVGTGCRACVITYGTCWYMLHVGDLCMHASRVSAAL